MNSMEFPEDFSNLAENYTILTTKNSIIIKCDNYIGYLRAMATLLQLIKRDPSSKDTYTYTGINITDYPDYYHRGLMLDTARHFIEVSTILRQFPAMMLSKLNVFHWHITDSDSFPYFLTELENLTLGGAFNQQKIYYPDDVQLIVETARKNGIMVIPEIDAPAHSRSWGLGGPLKGDMVCMDDHLDEPPCGEIDPTLNITYNVAQVIINQLMQQFPSNRVHLGGDEDDILQYWGSKKYIKNFTSETHKVILSPYDALYLDVGVGSLFGGRAWAGYNSWRDIIDFQPQSGGNNVIGAEAPLWSELNTDAVTEQKYWVRSCALADRVWNNQYYINFYDNNPGNQINVVRELAERLIQMESYFSDIGMQFSPTTSQYCALYPDVCWVPKINQSNLNNN